VLVDAAFSPDGRRSATMVEGWSFGTPDAPRSCHASRAIRRTGAYARSSLLKEMRPKASGESPIFFSKFFGGLLAPNPH
jgi:hypothetical protein